MNKLLLLGLVAVFLSLSVPQAHATNDGDLTYSSRSISFNQSVRPDMTYPTTVIITTNILAQATVVQGSESQISFEVSEDNSTWTKVGEHGLQNAVLVSTSTMETNQTTTFIVPKGQYYRVRQTDLIDMPIETIISTYEIQMDVFEQDPIPLPMCTQSAKPSETIYCMFTAYYQNNTPRNDLTYNVTVQNQSFTTILNTTATNRGSFGEYVFNFTSQSNVQTYYVRVYNTSVNYAKTITVATQYFGLTPEQNTTIYNISNVILTNETASRTIHSLSCDKHGDQFNDTITCVFDVLDGQGKYHNDIDVNYTVAYVNPVTVYETGATTNVGIRGVYIFDFQMTNETTIFVNVFNDTYGISDTLILAVHNDTLKILDSINATGDTILENVTSQFNSLNLNLFGNWTQVFLNFSHINDHLHNLTDQVGNITFDETNIIGNITNATNFILLNTTSQFGTTNTNIDNVDNDIFSWIMSNGDTYQEFIEGMDANLTNTNSTLHTHIDNINATCTGCSINATEVWDVVYNSSRTNKTQGTLLIDDWVARFMSPMS